MDLDEDVLTLVFRRVALGDLLAVAMVCRLFTSLALSIHNRGEYPRVTLSTLQRVKWAKSLRLMPSALSISDSHKVFETVIQSGDELEKRALFSFFSIRKHSTVCLLKKVFEGTHTRGSERKL